MTKESKVSVLQENAKLPHRGECWTWNQRLIRGSILSGGNILLLDFFLFSHSKASDASISNITDVSDGIAVKLVRETTI